MCTFNSLRLGSDSRTCRKRQKSPLPHTPSSSPPTPTFLRTTLPFTIHYGIFAIFSNTKPMMAESDPNASLTPDEAARIIHSHRKVRYGTACWPCRQRKVKCDNNNKQPCENCVKRDHANLCSYNPKANPAASNSKAGGVTGNLAAGVKRPRSEGGSGKEEERGWPRTTVGLDNHDEDPNESRYLGQNSIAAFLSEETTAGEPLRDGEQDVIRKDIMPILGLQISSASYPFMSKEHMDQIRHDIAAALPSDRDVLKSLQIYKQIVQPFWGLLVDVEDFEQKLCIYLEDRSSAANKIPSNSKGVSSAWLGMLFAVLAVAGNYTEESYHKRAATSQAFVQASFHCLRLSNFLIRPSMDSIQALLILGFVLANDMKAEASWALLGLTCRLAQALGLHRGPHERPGTITPSASDLPARRLWWAIVWQDTLLSLSFDRSPTAVMTRCSIPLSPTAVTIGFSYTEAMYHLMREILQCVNNDTNSQPDYNQIMADSLRVSNICNQMAPQLRLMESCKTLQDRLQYYAIRLHTSFTVSVLCRPALRRGEFPGMDAGQKQALAEKCKKNLTETVRMYLKMHSLSVIPTRSWAFTYHGLSSAVLLGILGETKTDPEVRQLQGNLINALSVTAAKDNSSPEGAMGGLKSDKDIELSGPLSRALVALRNIYDHGWVVEGKRLAGGASGNMGVEGGMGVGMVGAGPEQNQSEFEQQNAALAMASMQGGNMMPPLDYTHQMMPIGMSDTQAVEQTMKMSPMDLFDSIFWDPYPTTGMEGGMGYDYSSQLFSHF